MFNEAFWFFYWLSICGTVKVLGIGLMVVFLIVSCIVSCFAIGKDGDEDAKLLLKKLFVPILIVSFLFGVFTPPQKAFYAGAGQYVVEATEIDDTLMGLKTLLDDKIEELTDGD